jgi:hypothetical protein
VFPVGGKPAFEVVDAPAAPAPKPAARRKVETDDFEVLDDEPTGRAAADEGDDEPPRKKRKRDEDDDDDLEFEIVVYDEDGNELSRSGGKKKKRRDDDEDERPRKKKAKKKRRYDDDEDDWRPAPRGGGGFASARTGALLMGISFWLNLAAFGLLALFSLAAWLMLLAATGADTGLRVRGTRGDGSLSEVAVLLPGLVGLGAWIVGTVGCAFSIAGPARARGMAITATVFAGLHLVLTGVTFSNLHGGGGFGMARGIGMGSPAWVVVASTLPVLDSLLPMLFYSSRAVTGGDYAVALLAAVCELLRLIFMLLALKKTAEAARDAYAAEKAHAGLMAVAAVAGGVAGFTLLMVVLLAEGGFRSFQTIGHLTILTVLVMYAAYTFMMLNPAAAALRTKDACEGRR